MNGETLRRVIEEVVSRLQQRARSTATLSVAQLRQMDGLSLCCQYASLRIVLIDLPLLGRLVQRETADPGVAIIHHAIALGIHVELALHSGLLQAMPLKKLARLPVTFTDEHGQPLVLHAAPVLSYRDVAGRDAGRVVLHRRCVVTALAREAASERNIQLIKQE
ncbi:microcompartment protein PduM [Raoultella scottii]|uniref:microcompartment protein PduM n=1 Tax=Raoultella scottii TaxID=3040937 RepID=UPI002FAF7126